MNLALLENFGQNYPEEFDGTLDCISLAVTCAFNRRGTLFAVGCNDGRIIVWDFLTRGIARMISAHTHPVCSLSFSRSSNKLLSASTDNIVCVWDLLTSDCDRKFTFPSPIQKVQFHPRDENCFLVCMIKHPAVIIDGDGKSTIVPVDDETDVNIIAAYDRRGQHLYTGNAKGKVLALQLPELKVAASFRVTSGATSATAVKSIEFSRRGDAFLVNTADRVIRVYSSKRVIALGKDGEPEALQKLQDLVNKTMWKKCCFSGDGEYISAGSARQHALYIWEKSMGNLVKILHGTKGEMLLDVVWHPVRPIIASVSSGVVSIWAQPQVENWSAFAPEFKELDENVEYEERESEFDEEDEDKSVKAEESEEKVDSDVDVETVEPILAFCSSDEDEEDKDTLSYLPITLEIDQPEDGWGDGPADAPLTQSNAENEPPPKKKVKEYTVELKNAPVGEVHPLVQGRKDKNRGERKQQGGFMSGGASTSSSLGPSSSKVGKLKEKSLSRNKTSSRSNRVKAVLGLDDSGTDAASSSPS